METNLDLDEFKAATEQYVKDMNDAYNTYMEQRDQMADELKELNDQYMKQALDLSREYLETLKEYHEGQGEHPEQQ